MILNKKNYWNNFYKKFNLKKPSTFAKFVLKKNYIHKNSKVLDIGCGNGRDTFYFLNRKIKIIGIDKSETAINKNKNINSKIFLNIDVIKDKKNIVDLFKKERINRIYARFFLHTLNNKEEKIFIRFCDKILKKNDLILLEFRTCKDDMINKGKKISNFESITSHYRRFVDPIKFIKKLKKNYSLVYFMQKSGLSNYKRDNPNLARIVLKKIF